MGVARRVCEFCMSFLFCVLWWLVQRTAQASAARTPSRDDQIINK